MNVQKEERQERPFNIVHDADLLCHNLDRLHSYFASVRGDSVKEC